MEKLNIPYSLKNIPISHKKSTIEAKMVESAEDLFRRMRWKLFHFIAKAKSYNPEAKKCHLCITEKAKILYYRGEGLLNKRSEIMAKCRHRAKHKLAAV